MVLITAMWWQGRGCAESRCGLGTAAASRGCAESICGLGTAAVGRQAVPHHIHTQPPSPLHLLRGRDVEGEVGELLVRGADVAAAGADQVGAQRAAKHALRDVVCKGGGCAGGAWRGGEVGELVTWAAAAKAGRRPQDTNAG